MDHILVEAVKTKFVALDPLFDERLRRRWAAVEARLMGRGGIACVAAATGLSRTTIRTGLQELDAKQTADAEPDAVRLRRPGAGCESAGKVTPGRRSKRPPYPGL